MREGDYKDITEPDEDQVNFIVTHPKPSNYPPSHEIAVLHLWKKEKVW